METLVLDIFLLLRRILEDFNDFSMNILLFSDLLRKLRDIWKKLEEERINSTFETALNDFKLEDK